MEGMLKDIINQTNKHIEQKEGRSERERNAKITDHPEIQAMFVVLYFYAVLISGRVNNSGVPGVGS